VVLLGIQEHMEYDGPGVAGRQRTHDFMVASVAAVPQLASLTVFDEEGLAIGSSQSTLEHRYIQDDYFLHHQRVRTDQAYIGKPMRSRTTGQWIVTMSRRVNHADGSFAGVVVADVDLAHFQRYYEQFAIGRDGAILFGLTEGSVIYRQPLLSDSIGLDLSKSVLLTQYVSKADQGSFEMRSPRDDIVRLTSFQRCNLYPLFVAVALARTTCWKTGRGASGSAAWRCCCWSSSVLAATAWWHKWPGVKMPNWKPSRPVPNWSGSIAPWKHSRRRMA
jgi:hypothetical protein